jgi:hypothetical protein
MPDNPNHGGKRRGSGRHRVGKFTRSIFVTDAELAQVDKFISSLRQKPATVRMKAGKK